MCHESSYESQINLILPNPMHLHERFLIHTPITLQPTTASLTMNTRRHAASSLAVCLYNDPQITMELGMDTAADDDKTPQPLPDPWERILDIIDDPDDDGSAPNPTAL
jgi:hypothetical protein